MKNGQDASCPYGPPLLKNGRFPKSCRLRKFILISNFISPLIANLTALTCTSFDRTVEGGGQRLIGDPGAHGLGKEIGELQAPGMFGTLHEAPLRGRVALQVAPGDPGCPHHFLASHQDQKRTVDLFRQLPIGKVAHVMAHKGRGDGFQEVFPDEIGVLRIDAVLADGLLDQVIRLVEFVHPDGGLAEIRQYFGKMA